MLSKQPHLTINKKDHSAQAGIAFKKGKAVLIRIFVTYLFLKFFTAG